MNILWWIKWATAMLLAMMPRSVLPMSMKVATVSPKKRCAKPMVKPEVAVEGFIDDEEEEELLAIVNSIAQRQMRQRWGKDIDHIV